MEKYIGIIRHSRLFTGISDKEISSMLTCLSGVKKSYNKGDFVFRAGEITSSLGLVLSGSLHIIGEDFWGNRNILTQIGPTGLFAETYACAGNTPLEVSVITVQPGEILFLDVGKVLNACSSSCEFHSRLIYNLMWVLAEKNLMLTEKLNHITKRTTREKLLSYLSQEAQKHKNSNFSIPFNREELAAYLSVDRSALSNELSKLKNQGLISFSKNHFNLHLKGGELF